MKGLISFQSPFPISRGHSESLPTRLQLAPWGEFTTNAGIIKVADSTEKLLRHFGVIVIDFEFGTLNRVSERNLTAGVAMPIAIPGEGLFLDQIHWMRSALDGLARAHYTRVGAVVKCGSAGEIIMVRSGALLREHHG